MHMEIIFISETTIQNQKIKIKGICCDITNILGSSAGYREKQSHDRFTLGLKAFIHLCIFVTTFPLGRVAGAAAQGGLEVPHGQQ